MRRILGVLIGAAAMMIGAGAAFAQPKLVHLAKPVYPAEAKQNGIAGTVKLAATVDAAGAVTETRVLEGNPVLAAAAVEAVRQWRYTPTVIDGRAVAVLSTVTLNFALPAAIEIHDVVGGASIVKLVAQTRPVYPPEAKAAGIEGAVRLNAVIARDGTVRHVNVLSGDPALAEAAVTAVRQWRYEPVLLNGEAVDVLAGIVVNFTLSR